VQKILKQAMLKKICVGYLDRGAISVSLVELFQTVAIIEEAAYSVSVNVGANWGRQIIVKWCARIRQASQISFNGPFKRRIFQIHTINREQEIGHRDNDIG
jgi:hypothetical protein